MRASLNLEPRSKLSGARDAAVVGLFFKEIKNFIFVGSERRKRVDIPFVESL